eukprot:6187866-Pleurochrysis_carterae.AAC.2
MSRFERNSLPRLLPLSSALTAHCGIPKQECSIASEPAHHHDSHACSTGILAALGRASHVLLAQLLSLITTVRHHARAFAASLGYVSHTSVLNCLLFIVSTSVCI